MKSQEFTVSQPSDLDNLMKLISDCLDAFGSVSVEVTKGEKARTPTQNNCLHQYCEKLAQALNAAGLDMRKVMKPEAELPWTKHSAKDLLWRPIQRAMYGHESTTEPGTVEYQEIYKVLDRHIASKHGVSVEWPTRFNMKSHKAA